VLIDGAEALPEIAYAIESAQTSVWVAGWYFTPEYRLRRDRTETLRDLFAAAAERGVDVRLLGWGGAPLPLFPPDRGEAKQMARAFGRDTGVKVALDSKERPLHCHHEKIAVVDGRLAFVGGIDLTSYGGDRFDTHEHPPRESVGWHDATSRFRGPAVADVAAHFRLRWHEVTGEELPETGEPAPGGDVELQVVRTIPEKIYARLPGGEFGIVASYLGALRAAQRLVYLENQFLWSPELVTVLADKLHNPPDDDFRLLVLLPAKPNNGKDDTRGQLGVLVDADKRSRPVPRLHALSGRRRRTARLRAREDRARRRRVADDRLGEPERALALQRHRDERRHAGRSTRPPDAAATLERAPRRSGRGDRRQAGRRHRQAVAPARGGPARAATRRPPTHTAARPPPARLAPDGGPPRPDQRLARRRLSS
jgi:phosphatidylserine/phosphatidylglycerophosphate/cardiolipin synthase-like enzyme